MVRDLAEFHSPVKILAGKGAMDNLAVELASLDAHKPLAIARAGTQEGAVSRALVCAFGETGVDIGIFAGVNEKPTLALIKDIYDIYTRRGFDSIIAVGGGDVVHTAKIANIAVSLSPDFLRQFLAGATAMPSQSLRPLVLLPDFVVDGYECSLFSLFNGRRYASPSLIPHAVIVDKYALPGVFSASVALSSAVAMVCALDSYSHAGRSVFADAYANALLGLLVAGVTKTGKTGKWKLPLANSLSLAGFLLSNTAGGLGHNLAAAISEKTAVALRECLGAILPCFAEQVLQRDGVAIGEMLMPALGCDSPADVEQSLRATCEKLSAAAGVRALKFALSPSEREEIAASVLGGSARAGCLEIMGRLCDGR